MITGLYLRKRQSLSGHIGCFATFSDFSYRDEEKVTTRWIVEQPLILQRYRKRVPKKWFRILPAEVRGVPPASKVLGKWMI